MKSALTPAKIFVLPTLTILHSDVSFENDGPPCHTLHTPLYITHKKLNYLPSKKTVYYINIKCVLTPDRHLQKMLL